MSVYGNESRVIRLPWKGPGDQAEAAKFIAELVRQGLTFQAVVDDYELWIHLTGGF